MTLPEVFASLPQRYSSSPVLRNFPRAASTKIIERFSLPEVIMQNVYYHPDHIIVCNADHATVELKKPHVQRFDQIRQELQNIFSAEFDFAPITQILYTDGVRIFFSNGDVTHFRTSGNADELRIYCIAHTQEGADSIASQGVAEPNGFLRRLEHMV